MDNRLTVYHKCNLSKLHHMIAYIISSILCAIVVYLFYRIIILSIILGLIGGIFLERMYAEKTTKTRQRELLLQFRSFMESMGVAARAGQVEVHALRSALKDLKISYKEGTDILIEVQNIITKYEGGGYLLKDLFKDFGERSGLPDIENFATIYEVIEGKSDRFADIINQTQEIIADKIEIEQEIETVITSAKSETNMMLIMPLVIVIAMGSVGGDFLTMLFQGFAGRAAATAALACFIISYVVAVKASDIEV